MDSGQLHMLIYFIAIILRGKGVTERLDCTILSFAAWAQVMIFITPDFPSSHCTSVTRNVE